MTSQVRAETAGQAEQGAAVAPPAGLTGQVIDSDPQLLEQSYNLRYQVYCLERGFLAAADYPDRREIDEFDQHSVHIGVVNTLGEVVGTARLVKSSDAGLPLFHHCSLFEDALPDKPPARIVETSRLAIGRRKDGEIVVNIFKAVYQASKRLGFTHWLAATERSLQRLMIRYGFPWKAVGPEADYYGIVVPYLMDLREFDKVILSGRIPMLDTFLDGLEPEFYPANV